MASAKGFASAAAFRKWLEEHHDSEDELWIKYWKKASGKKGMVYKEALDEALCFGWIDGQVQSIDEHSYKQRWTPRRKGSIWSNVNVAKVKALIEAGRMTKAGLAAFEARERVGVYAFESPVKQLSPEYEARFKAAKRARAWFDAQPPGYRRIAIFWVMDAKQEATRERRLELLIECSAAGNKIPSQRRPSDK